MAKATTSKTKKVTAYPLNKEWLDITTQTNMVTPTHMYVDNKVWMTDTATRNLYRLDINTGKWENLGVANSKEVLLPLLPGMTLADAKWTDFERAQLEWLHASLPETIRGVHAADSQALIPAVVEAVKAGDVVLVKGSLGSRMAPIVEALLAMGLAMGGPPAAAQRCC